MHIYQGSQFRRYRSLLENHTVPRVVTACNQGLILPLRDPIRIGTFTSRGDFPAQSVNLYWLVTESHLHLFGLSRCRAILARAHRRCRCMRLCGLFRFFLTGTTGPGTPAIGAVLLCSSAPSSSLPRLRLRRPSPPTALSVVGSSTALDPGLATATMPTVSIAAFAAGIVTAVGESSSSSSSCRWGTAHAVVRASTVLGPGLGPAVRMLSLRSCCSREAHGGMFCVGVSDVC
jgi:hypothetical protein